ncbi:MAG: hypothetical protein HS127_09980 [Planctomycetia bacterium]|nr:hypothetical protein [Planctomycetia bacterium]
MVSHTPENDYGVPKDIIKATRMYSTNKYDHLRVRDDGAQGDSHRVMSLADLALITRNVGRPNAGINPLRGQNNIYRGRVIWCIAGRIHVTRGGRSGSQP